MSPKPPVDRYRAVHARSPSSRCAPQYHASASTRATDNREVIEMLDELRAPIETTPTLEPPGPAIGVLKTLLPRPEEWGFDGYGETSPLLPRPSAHQALPAPDAGGE